MTVAAVKRAFQLLQAVPGGDGTLTSLANDTGLPIATVSRIMGTLEQAGAVLRSDKAYRIGPALIDLANNGHAAYDLMALATTHLARIANQTNETSGIAEAVGHDVVHLGQIATDHDVSVRDWTGFQVAAHSGCIGFVIMAHWPPAKLRAYLASELEAFSPSTLTDPAAIGEQLEAVRNQGWLWTTDQYAVGVTTVAAPIFDRDGAAVAALYAHGPSFRFPDEARRRMIGADVASRASSISSVLGWREPADG